MIDLRPSACVRIALGAPAGFRSYRVCVLMALMGRIAFMRSLIATRSLRGSSSANSNCGENDSTTRKTPQNATFVLKPPLSFDPNACSPIRHLRTRVRKLKCARLPSPPSHGLLAVVYCF